MKQQNKQYSNQKIRNNKNPSYVNSYKGNNNPNQSNRTNGNNGYVNGQSSYEYYEKVPLTNYQNPIFTKEELIKRGEEIFNETKSDIKVKNLIDKFTDCFKSQKRNVQILKTKNNNSSISDNYSYVPRVQNNNIKYNSKANYNKQEKEDESIPEWFDDEPVQKQSVFFDFHSTVDRTNIFNNEISKKVNAKCLGNKTIYENSQEGDFEEIDQLLEKKFFNLKKEIDEPENKEFINFEIDEEDFSDIKNEETLPVFDQSKLAANKLEDSADESLNNSTEYFGNLHENIKALLLNKDYSSSEDDKESEESFQESLGFEYNRDHNKTGDIDRSLNKSDLKPENIFQNIPESLMKKKDSIHEGDAVNNNNISHLSSSIDNKIIIDTHPPTAKSFISLSDQSEKKVEVIPEPKNENYLYNRNEFDYLTKLTETEKAQRQEAFMKKYGFLSTMISQIFHEMKKSSHFLIFKQLSPLITDDNIALYLNSTYKIFSILLEGDISSKVWLIKNKNNETTGPFISFDMDILYSRNKFEPETEIALIGTPFVPYIMYTERSFWSQNVCARFKELRKNVQVAHRPKRINHNNGNRRDFKKNVYIKNNIQKHEPDFYKDDKITRIVSQKEEIKDFENEFPSLDNLVNSNKRNNINKQKILTEPKTEISKIPLQESSVNEVLKLDNKKSNEVQFKNLDDFIKIVPSNLIINETDNKSLASSNDIQKVKPTLKSIELSSQVDISKSTSNVNGSKKNSVLEVKDKQSIQSQGDGSIDLTRNIKEMLGLKFN